MAKTEKELLREQLDKHVNYSGNITDKELTEIVSLELDAMAYDALLQSRKNLYSRRKNSAVLEYRKRYGLEGVINNGFDDIEAQEYIAVYLDKHKDTVLDSKELETAALAEFVTELDSIDIEVNTTFEPMIEATLSAEMARLTEFTITSRGIKDKLKNYKATRKNVNWK